MDNLAASALNVIVVSLGGLGDIHPMLALGDALRKRGHRVCFVSNPYFEPLARRLGLDFAGFGSAQRFASRLKSARLRSGGRRLVHALIHSNWATQGLVRWRERTRAILRFTRWLYDFIEENYVPGETVVVAPARAFGARTAQEKLGVPLATVHLQPAMLRSAHDAPGLPLPQGDGAMLRNLRRWLWASIDSYVDLMLWPEMNRFRRELGLAPVRRPFSGWVHSPQLVISLFPDWFAPPQPDWPPNNHEVGFPLFDEAVLRQVPSELEAFLRAGAPPLVFTAGSHSQNAHWFFKSSVAACSLLGQRGILLGSIPDLLVNNLPETVRHFEYIPLSAVLPKAAALVHHGGIGTTALALAAGVPQLIVPFVDDQNDNAARVQRLGAGLTASRRRYRAKSAARKLERLLTSAETARRCQALAARMREQDPLSEACRLIEEVATLGTPGQRRYSGLPDSAG